MIIGITGKSGAGKSYLANQLATLLNATHINIDEISHSILNKQNCIDFLKANFDYSIFNNNILDRKQLGLIVFNDKNKLEQLNKFCKIEIENELDNLILKNKSIIILDYALLTGLKQFYDCDIKILLTTDLETRFQRAFEREKISKEYFIKRDNSIEDYDIECFDYIFENITESEIKSLASQIKNRLN